MCGCCGGDGNRLFWKWVESWGGGWSLRVPTHHTGCSDAPSRPSLSFLGDWDLERSGRWIGAMSVIAPSHPPLYLF